MTKIRMNTEFRNKILNRYVDHAEKENTQEREGYLQSLEQVDVAYKNAFMLAELVRVNSTGLTIYNPVFIACFCFSILSIHF